MTQNSMRRTPCTFRDAGLNFPACYSMLVSNFTMLTSPLLRHQPNQSKPSRYPISHYHPIHRPPNCSPRSQHHHRHQTAPSLQPSTAFPSSPNTTSPSYPNPPSLAGSASPLLRAYVSAATRHVNTPSKKQSHDRVRIFCRMPRGCKDGFA